MSEYEFEQPEDYKYRDVDMWFQCPTCNKSFEVDEPDNYCQHYKEDEDESESNEPLQ